MRLWHLYDVHGTPGYSRSQLGKHCDIDLRCRKTLVAHRLFVDIPVYIGPGAGSDVDLLYDACTFLR